MSGFPIEAVPFPYLADVLQDSRTEDAICILKAVTQLTFHTQHFKILEKIQPRLPHLNSLKSRLKQTYSLCDSAIPPHVSSLLGIKKIFEFVYEHADRVDEPPDTLRHVDIYNEMTVTEEWLVQCVLHPGVETDEEFRSDWSEYILLHLLRNNVDLAETYYAKRVGRAYVEGASMGLHRALQPYLCRETYDIYGVYYILIEYMRLAATAAKVWELVWRGYGIIRGTTVGIEGDILEILAEIERYYAKRLCDEEDSLPLYIRQHRAHMNISGEFLVLVNWVFPSTIAPAGSTICEDEFATAYRRWIIDAATSPDVDPDGRVAELVRTSGMAPSPAGSYSLSAFNPPRSIIDDHSLEDGELEDGGLNDSELEDNELEDIELEDGELEDVQLLPCGKRNKVDDYTDQIVFPPSGMVCTICYEEFGSDVDESSRRQLAACKHSFHWVCLDGWINSSHFGELGCPNCRQPICDARPRRPKVSRT
jgi:hypothetical protein